MADLTSDKHEQYRKVLEEIIVAVQYYALEHELGSLESWRNGWIKKSNLD